MVIEIRSVCRGKFAPVKETGQIYSQSSIIAKVFFVFCFFPGTISVLVSGLKSIRKFAYARNARGGYLSVWIWIAIIQHTESTWVLELFVTNQSSVIPFDFFFFYGVSFALYDLS